MSGDDLVIMRNYSGCDEINHDGVSYRPNKWGVVRVPASAVPPLLRTGGFHVASPDDVSAVHSNLDDVLDVVWCLELGRVRDTLMMIMNSPNSLNHLIQSISFS
jgi:hypothetical protein